MAMSLGELFVTLKVKTDKSLSSAPTKLKRTGSAARGLGASLKGMGAAFTAALGPIGVIIAALASAAVAISKVIKAADIQNQAINRMNIALANQGNLLPGTSQRLQEYANEMQRTTKFGDEVILSANAMAASFGANENEIKRIVTASADMAEVMGIDLKAAVNLVGKAFVGETGSLSRYGIIIDQNIPKTEKFEAVMSSLNERFGGTAQSATQTLGGALTQLGNGLGDILESVGILLQSFFDLGGGGTGGLEWLTLKVADLATWLRQDLVIAMSEAKAQVIEFVASAAQSFLEMEMKVASLVGIFNTDLSDALANDALALQVWVGQQREAATAIRENADQLANMGTSLEVTNQAVIKETAAQKQATIARDFGTAALARFNAEGQAARMNVAMLAQEEELLAATTETALGFVANDVIPPFGVAYTTVGGLVETQSQRMANAFATFGASTKSESAAVLAAMERDFELISQSGEASAKTIAAAEKRLAEQRKLNSDTNTAGAVDMFSTINGAASQALSGLAGKNKAWAIGMAIMNTAVAVTKALTTLPWPANLISAAGSAAAGAVQVAKIKSQSTAGFRLGTPDLDFRNFGVQQNVQLHGNEAVIPQGSGHKLASEIANAMAPSQPIPSTGTGAMPTGAGARTSTSGGATIIFELNSREIARAMVPDIEDLTKRRVLRIHPAATGKEF